MFDESTPEGSSDELLLQSPPSADTHHAENSPQETRPKRWGGKRGGAGRPKGRKTRSEWRKPEAPVVYEPFSGLRWYVCRVQHPFEEDGAEELDKLGVERLLPQEEVRLLRKNRVGQRVPEDVKRPLYPGFVFARFDATVYNWRLLPEKSQYIHQVVCTSPLMERPYPLPDGLLESLVRDLKLDEKGIVSRIPPAKLPKLASGTKVRLVGDHVFAGQEAVVRWSSARSVRLWLGALGKVEVPRRLVQPLAA